MSPDGITLWRRPLQVTRNNSIGSKCIPQVGFIVLTSLRQSCRGLSDGSRPMEPGLADTVAGLFGLPVDEAPFSKIHRR